MHGGAQVVLLGFVEGGFHDRRTRSEELDAFAPALGHLAHPFAGVLGRGNRCVAILAKADVCDQMRGHDLVGRTAFAVVERPLRAVEAAGLADGGYAVAHPQLEHVLGRRALRGAAQVAMHIDKARQDVMSAQVDLTVAPLWALTLVDGYAGIADAGNVGDAVVLDHNVNGTSGRSARAINEGGPTQHQALVRAVALVGAIGGGRRSGLRPDDMRPSE